MSTYTTPHTRFGWVPWALLAWSAATFAFALLPDGAGDFPRALNALLFLVLAPAFALMFLLRDTLPPTAAAVVSLGSSLGILVLSSQLLLLVDLWSPWGVTAMVGAATLIMAFAPWQPRRED